MRAGTAMMTMQQTQVGLEWNNCAAESAADKTLEINSLPTFERKLTVKYGGAQSGVYDLEVLSTANGALTTDAVSFEAKI